MNHHFLWNCRNLTPEQNETRDNIAAALNLPPIIGGLLVRRGVTTAEEARQFLHPKLADGLHDPFLMNDMDKAVARLNEAIGRREKILIYGDYDVDGISAVAFVYRFLRNFTTTLDYYIPDRYDDGYGISEKGIDYAADGGFTLTITLDCGIKAIKMVEYAKSKGIDFIICDHHKPDAQLPAAVAILDPKRTDNRYPYPHLSACGVGLKFMQAFARDNGLSETRFIYPNLDLCALSIASDIVPMTGENRVLSYNGLRRLNERPCTGLRATIESCGLEKRELTNSDIVFKIGPRINASGRMMCGKEAVDLLVTRDMKMAKECAVHLAEYNENRKELDKKVTEEAIAQATTDPALRGKKSVLVYNPTWHKGVIGIVASRLTEHFYRPAVVLTNAGGFASGSARSVQGFNVYNAIDSCRDIVENFGGHSFASGLTLKEENVAALARRFEAYVESHITPAQEQPHFDIDLEIPLQEITLRLYKGIKGLAPFGPGNARPLFVTRRIVDNGESRLVGKENEHIRLEITDPETGASQNGIAFNLAHKWDIVQSGHPFDIVYTIEENSYNPSTVQLLVKDIRLSEEDGDATEAFDIPHDEPMPESLQTVHA